MKKNRLEFTMYDKLLMLPLFQGLSRFELTQTIEKVKLHFVKYRTHDCIIKRGEECRKLTFILDGNVISERKDEEKDYSWHEYYEANSVLEPISFFGLKTTYNASYYAEGLVHTLSLDKEHIYKHFAQFPSFQLNYLNLACNRAQALKQRSMLGIDNSIENKLRLFFLACAEKETGQKMLKVKLTSLANLMNVSRHQLTIALKAMTEKGWVEQKKQHIIIPEIKALK